MAIGNIGNLLQHFVALRVAQKVVDAWQRPGTPIEYIDCYSMAPWEPVTGGQPQGFVDRVNSFSDTDFVAAVFRRAWRNGFGEEVLNVHPQNRQYPNSAVLLRTAFPEQHWRMRLHEDDSTETGKRQQLSNWAAYQVNGTYDVKGNWHSSKLILNSPAPLDRPTLVMLDPFQVVNDKNSNSENCGYLSARLLGFLCGIHALNINDRNFNDEIPVIFTIFSYSNSTPDKSDAVVRKRFNDNRWFVDEVRSGPWQGRSGPGWHQGWIVSTGMHTPVLGRPVQEVWDEWNR